MNCQVENYKNYAVPVRAGNFRFLLGLLIAFAGLYITVAPDIQAHGLGLLIIIGSPFVMFKDEQ